MKEIDPGELTIVINECYKISILRMRKNRTHALNICMNNLKQAEARLPCIGNDKDLLLASLQETQSKAKAKWEENSCIFFKLSLLTCFKITELGCPNFLCQR